MKSAKITLNPPEIKSITFNNTFNQKPGEPIKLAVKTQVGIKTNPAAPTTAMVFVKTSVIDEDKNLSLDLETMNLVVASTFLDNLDQIIQKQYLPIIMLAVNEKVRSVTADMGINLKLPIPTLDYVESAESTDSLYFN